MLLRSRLSNAHIEEQASSSSSGTQQVQQAPAAQAAQLAAAASSSTAPAEPLAQKQPAANAIGRLIPEMGRLKTGYVHS